MITAARVPFLFVPDADRSSRWFSAQGCVVCHADLVEVFVGGSLIGTYAPGDRGARNVILVGLARDPRVHLGKLADAFEVVPETLRQVRRQADTEGLDAVIGRAPGGSESKITAALRRRLRALFDDGLTVSDAHARVGRRHGVSRSTVGKVRGQWAEERTGRVVPSAPQSAQVALPMVDAPEPLVGSEEESTGADVTIEDRSPAGGRTVQHVGAWVMVATVARLGVHERAERLREGRVDGAALRIALDAVIIALSIGQRCVEGVRRLATTSAGVLLRAAQVPSASWVRRVLGRFSRKGGGTHLHLQMAGELARAALEAEGPTVFYVDNHLRPYTGKHVVRRGWRMQDKRVRPGTTDYYVHDQSGHPVLRIDVPQHRSLTDFLTPIGGSLRAALGEEEVILLAFDRAGAFPAQMVELRDADFEFVTYERRPYPLLATTAFEHELRLDDETVRLHDARTNLGKGRGRVRRISVLHEDGRQVNLLAVSEASAKLLINVMAGRWAQENSFKHGVERWGINQLDGRTVTPYSPEEIVPNPARRRLDHALRIARVREGDARRELARLASDDRRRARWKEEIAEATRQQKEIEALRPSVPKHARLAETELAGKLVQHDGHYKATLDTIRIACANGEADLATELAPLLPRPREAKRVLQNLFSAPGRVRVGTRTIAIDVSPAGTKRELAAIRELLARLSRRGLTLPGDPRGRRLHFRSP